jgi:hypothetical protein
MSNKMAQAIERMADRAVNEPADKALQLAKAMRLMSETYNILVGTALLENSSIVHHSEKDSIDAFLAEQGPIAKPKN